MKKKIKKYISGGIAVALLLTAIPSRTVAGPYLDNDRNVIDVERASMSDGETLEDHSKELYNVSEAEGDIAENTVSSPESIKNGYVPGYHEETKEDVTGTDRALDDADTEDITAAFTDPIFLSAVRNVLDLREDEPITKYKCEGIKKLDVDGMGIKSLDGIKYFKSLKMLDCSNNQLETLDISGCVIGELNCSHNQLAILDVSGCPSIAGLDCSNNQLTNLIVNGCYNNSKFPSDSATEFYFSCKLDCSNNRLENLDISNSPCLRELNCSDNLFVNIDIPENLDVLTISNCPNLQNLNGIPERLTLNVSGCTDLQTLKGDFKGLSAKGCINLRSLTASIRSNFDIGGCTNLQFIDVEGYEEGYTSGNPTDAKNRLGILDFSGYPNLQTLKCHGATEINVSNCINLNSLECFGDIESLNVNGCINLRSLKCIVATGYGHYPSLTHLDVSSCTKLESLDCSRGRLTNLNLNGCMNLKSLDCSANSLNNLDVKSCTKLESLDCSGCGVTNLDVSGCKNLRFLDCTYDFSYNNFPPKLTHLNVSNCINLESLDCSTNLLKKLDIKDCINLKSLDCASNLLTKLDIKDCIKLQSLDCTYNNMISPNDVKGTKKEFDGNEFKFYPQNNISDTTPIPGTKKSQNLSVKPQIVKLYVGGDTKTLKVSNAKGKVTYKSSNTKVAKTNAKGKIIPLSKGKATITVTSTGNDTYKPATVKVKVTVYGKPTKVTGVKAVAAKKKGTLKVSWKKISSATGYTIRYSYNKNMKGSKSINVPNGKITSKTLNKLISKKYVYIQICASQKKNGLSTRGSWSEKVKSDSKIR